MMKNQRKPWYTALALILVIALIVPILSACDDDDDDETIQSTTEQPAATQPATTIPADTSPIKIGVIGAWTGSAAMVGILTDQAIKVVNAYLEETGGILGGRSVEFVKFDGKSQVSDSVAGFKKLVEQDEVSIVVGGSSPAVFAALADAAEENEVPYATLGGVPEDLSGYPYVVRAGYNTDLAHELIAKFIINDLKPKTIAVLSLNDNLIRNLTKRLLSRLEPLGAEAVYEQYAQQGTTDMSPYLTQINSKEPDLLLTILGDQSMASNINKTIPTLGGWRGITVLNGGGEAATADPLNEGDYGYAPWTSGLTDPGSLEFERLVEKAGAKMPANFLWYQYVSLMVAIQLVDQAGTDDPVGIAEYAKSGDFSWDLMPGMTTPFRIDTSGEDNLPGVLFKVEGGNPVYIPVE